MGAESSGGSRLSLSSWRSWVASLSRAQQRSAPLILAAFEAANHDESMSALADQLRGQRAETAAWLVDELIARASLRGEITREQAIDTIWLLMDPHGFIALTRDRGWTAERFEAWFIDSVRALLLADESAPSPATTRSRPSRPTTSTSKRRTS